MNKNITIITLNQPNITNFSKVRNLTLDSAKTPWILFLDSDEKLTPALTREINEAIENKEYNYQLKRQDWFLGKQLMFGETSRFRSTRLVQKGTGKWHGKVHEEFISTLPVKTLKYSILHQRNITITSFLNRLNTYSSLKAQEESQFSLFKLLTYPPLKFIQNYFLRLGFLDGLPGLIMAFSMSLHSLSVRIKVYEKTV
jgi:hypothetical protein